MEALVQPRTCRGSEGSEDARGEGRGAAVVDQVEQAVKVVFGVAGQARRKLRLEPRVAQHAPAPCGDVRRHTARGAVLPVGGALAHVLFACGAATTLTSLAVR